MYIYILFGWFKRNFWPQKKTKVVDLIVQIDIDWLD